MSLYLIILIATVAVSVLSFNQRDLYVKLLFSPYEIQRKKQWYRFFTYGFVHADFIHLFVNMWVLYIFGDAVENTLFFLFSQKGMLYFSLLYTGGLAFSTLYAFGKHRNNYTYSAVGASGAVSSVVFAYIMMYPLAGLMIFPFPFEIPAFVFGLLYIIYSWIMARRGKDNIGHDAHLFGALYGIVFIIIVYPDFLKLFIKQVF
ncbi:MAG: rhomboid family intramembrane serine protease [Bacteroidetes bacterium HGW-Bacteroidetes-6]|jgi:membrane associated rhomboid family serine protease|nr:MAG: rhomboid family intramembrane serine protease [Bacteroidetes bacterium HGW-Bacteroidetes-6]